MNRIELLQETTEIQKKQNNLLLDRIRSLHQTYSEQMKEHTLRLRTQYEDTLKDYIQQQSDRLSQLQNELEQKQREITKLKEQTKQTLEERDAQHTKETKEWVIAIKNQKEYSDQLFDDLKISYEKKLGRVEQKQALLKQHMAEVTMTCAQQKMQLKEYEKTVSDQSGRIEQLMSKNKEWVDKFREMEEKSKQSEGRFGAQPQNFYQIEEDYKKEISKLLKENDLLQRSNKNWQSKYSMLAAFQRKASSSSVGYNKK